ncbi:MAG TPA: DUF2059 domain-containing protein [Candidatus Angelobacter sp.]|jgi:hypothetical protein
MSKAFFKLLLIALCVLPCFAQQSSTKAATKSRPASQGKKASSAPVAAADAPTREDVLKLFNLLQVAKTMDAVVSTTKQQSMEVAQQMIQEKIPQASAAQKKELREKIEGIMGQALGPDAIKQMLEATIPVYQHHLTKADLQAMVAFYTSPVGQKILHEQPAMVQESMEASEGIQQRIARAMFQKIDEQIEKMADAPKEPVR